MQAMQSNKFTRCSPKTFVAIAAISTHRKNKPKNRKKEAKKLKKSRRKKCSNINYPLYTYLAHNSWSRCIAFHFLLVSLCAQCVHVIKWASSVSTYVAVLARIRKRRRRRTEKNLSLLNVENGSHIFRSWSSPSSSSSTLVVQIVLCASVWNVSYVCVCVVVMMPF